MIIKKFQAKTEKEAINMAKEELGKDAIVMNIKIMKPKGLFKAFRKTIVEVTAAIDENPAPKEDSIKKEEIKEAKTSAIEEKLNSLTELLEKQMSAPSKEHKAPVKEEVHVEKNSYINTEKEADDAEKEDKFFDLIFEKLVANEVREEYANSIVNEFKHNSAKVSLDDILAKVYQKIVLKLGDLACIEPGEKKPKVVLFIGPTGVGKTTTIAKLASKYKLEKKMKLALITADTYRIAAVEQIKTYANILNIPIEVIYESADIKDAVDKFKGYDYVFVDTAGRSHNNQEQCADIKDLIEQCSDFDTDVYLVVSAITKYNDLVKICDIYSDITDFSIIFTKLDETGSYGNLLNIKLKTGVKLSYVAWGQNVPDDLGELDAQIIAKHLLGGGGQYGSSTTTS